MQYLGNLPFPQLAFGRITSQADLSRMLSLRTLHNDAVRYPRLLAVKQGAPLFAMLHRAMHETAVDRKCEAPVSLYVGHDGNFAAIRSILGFNWQAPEHARNDVNPGAMMMFERVRQLSSGAVFVRISYLSPTLDQIRHLSPYGNGSPPFFMTFAPPKAWGTTLGLIPLQRLTLLAEGIARDAVPDPFASTPVTNEISFPY